DHRRRPGRLQDADRSRDGHEDRQGVQRVAPVARARPRRRACSPFNKMSGGGAMNARKLTYPLLAFVGGAVLGRILGLSALARAGMAVVAAANTWKAAGLPSLPGPRPARQTVPARTGRKRAARTRAPVKKTSARPERKRTSPRR